MNGAGSAFRSLVGGAALAVGALGCSGEQTAASTAAIRGGALAPDDSAVVGVVNFVGGQCTGSLIAPRLVLTARHCVASTAGEDLRVLCGETAFEQPKSPGAIFVVPQPEITELEEDYKGLAEIVLPEGVDSDLCGTDVVLLVLDEPITDITPLVPRIDAPVEPGESYSAVGFGADEDIDGSPAGVRKRLDELQVACSGQDCGVSDIRDNEWVGSGGPCHGDSGGPALDAEGRVIGVVSRGKDGCGEPVFGDVATRAAWLKSEAVRVANLTYAEPPDWAPCDDTNPCAKPPQGDSLESSCSASGHRSSGAELGPAMLGWLVLTSRRRRAGTEPARALPTSI